METICGSANVRQCNVAFSVTVVNDHFFIGYYFPSCRPMYLLIIGGGSRILNHESRLKKSEEQLEGIMTHIISQAVSHESWTKNK